MGSIEDMLSVSYEVRVSGYERVCEYWVVIFGYDLGVARLNLGNILALSYANDFNPILLEFYDNVKDSWHV
jgi:hypothetical protein